MGLTENDRKKIVKYRLDKAKETIAEIENLIDNNHTESHKSYNSQFRQTSK